jgi:hypothetical protein
VPVTAPASRPAILTGTAYKTAARRMRRCWKSARVLLGEYATYPDIDMKTKPGVGYVHKDGTPYPKMPRRDRLA